MAVIDDILEYAVAIILTIALIMELAAFWLLSQVTWPAPEGSAAMVATVYDSQSREIVFVDGVKCVKCGGTAIATTCEQVCNNKGCVLYGLPVRRQN